MGRDTAAGGGGRALLRRLREEQAVKLPGGLYHELQIRLAYNSNRIEGCSLTERQTRFLFETNTIESGDGIPVDDVIETVNHFRAFDYVLDVAEEPLGEMIAKDLHRILKQATKDASMPWFAVGDYKKRGNTAGGRGTARPEEVPGRMRALLDEYGKIPAPDIGDIIAFHWEFECIHPFQDGNGRVGRLIAFKECLKNGIVPFLIEDAKKMFYYRGLAEWEREKGFLTDTCLDGQDTFKRLLSLFGP